MSKDRHQISSASRTGEQMRREERQGNSLSLVRPLEPVLARKLVNLLGSTRSVRVFLGLGRLAVFTVDPVEERGEDLYERGNRGRSMIVH